MKDILRIIGMALLVVVAVVVVAGSKGNDELNFDFGNNEEEQNLNEEYYYSIEKAPENGQYISEENRNMYAMLGKNSDGTYKLYFIKTLGMNRQTILRVENLEIKSDKSGSFRNNSNKVLTIILEDKSFSVEAPPKTVGDSEIEGNYKMMHPISSFSADEFKIK